MKEFLKENWGILLIVGLFTTFILLISLTTEIKEVGGVVLEHNVTADKTGHRTYSTIVKTDDGFIEEETGLKTYVVPVGERVTIEVTRTKNKTK
jgi:hypothetical protein